MDLRITLIFILAMFAAGMNPVLVRDADAQSTVRWDKTSSRDFLRNQLKNEKVKTAVKEKKAGLETLLKSHSLSFEDLNILLLANKNNATIDVYAKSKAARQYELLTTYDICYASGDLGPKREEGDEQTPEGFYFIETFNTRSSYYLSLKINYPNESDLILTTNKMAPGSQILIHGDCVSIGCMAMTHEVIKELYLLAIYAAASGQLQIPVYIVPFRMVDENMEKVSRYEQYQRNMPFWRNLKEGYDLFMKTRQELNVSVLPDGSYAFSVPGDDTAAVCKTEVPSAQSKNLAEP